MVSWNLCQAHLLEVGMTRIPGDHETLSIVLNPKGHFPHTRAKSRDLWTSLSKPLDGLIMFLVHDDFTWVPQIPIHNLQVNTNLTPSEGPKGFVNSFF